MPRYRRTIRPGDLVHVISRFVNREFRLTCVAERDQYLRRLGGCIAESDWRLLSYAMMSSHIHLTLVAGWDPFEGLVKRVHSGFSGWLNRRQARLGPVFADRPKTIITPPIWTARLVAYHHNNPVRAGVVSTADESRWTSHRAYAGADSCPEWLDVELGLQLMGFGGEDLGRRAFQDYVVERKSHGRDVMLTGDLRAASRELRESLGLAVCVAHPRTGPAGLDYAPSIAAKRWSGDLDKVIDLVADERGAVSVDISGPSRRRDIVAARRVVVLLSRLLGRTNTEIGLHLGVSEGAVRKLAKTALEPEREMTMRLLQWFL